MTQITEMLFTEQDNYGRVDLLKSVKSGLKMSGMINCDINPILILKANKQGKSQNLHPWGWLQDYSDY